MKRAKYMIVLAVVALVFMISCDNSPHTAKTIEQHTVTFDSKGGSAVESVQVVKNSKAANPIDPIKDEYYFAGWYKEASFITKWNFENDRIVANTTLHAKWNKLYAVGEEGPAGGYVFYDNPDYEQDGWRYLEAAPAGWSGEEKDPKYQFGYYRPDGGETEEAGTSLAIGSGKANTEALVNAMGEEAYQFFGVGDEKIVYAAKAASDYSVTVHGVEYTGWFLPSYEELNLMKINLHKQRKGGFSSNYWTSSEVDSRIVRTLFMDAEGNYNTVRWDNYHIRPARAF